AAPGGYFLLQESRAGSIAWLDYTSCHAIRPDIFEKLPSCLRTSCCLQGYFGTTTGSGREGVGSLHQLGKTHCHKEKQPDHIRCHSNHAACRQQPSPSTGWWEFLSELRAGEEGCRHHLPE